MSFNSSFEDILQFAEVGPEHPFFYPRISTYLNRNQSPTKKLTQQEYIETVCKEEYDDLSRRLDRTGLQESCSVRNVLKCRKLANIIIDDEGEIRSDLLPLFISSMKENLYSLGPGKYVDAVRDTHILKVLETLLKSKEIYKILKHITRPVSNRLAEQIVRDTLQLSTSIPITDVHVRRACLSAWLTYLRQSLGSCFATAPAILVHTEQPLLFLKDLDEMMNTGRMRRTFAGKENSVPLSYTWGNGDLYKPFIIEHDLNHNENKVWMSPGIIAALDATGHFPDHCLLKEKVHIARKLLEESLPLLEKKGSIFLTCADDLIRALLLHKNGLVQKQVDEFLKKPKTMVQSGLMMHVPRTSKFAGPKGADACTQYLKDLDLARNAFKSLADNALLKAWEFTLASFSEIHLEFCRWNLYSSLGINYDDPGGIGQCIYERVNAKVEHANAQLKEQQLEYDQVISQVQYVEARMRQASTEQEINWLKMEYQSRQADLYNLNQIRQTVVEKANKVSKLYQFLIETFDKKFCDYFQEIYDADLHEVTTGPFDDSPAGYRLIYKHGRTNPSLWTRITSLSEFVESLVSFFTIVEQEITSSAEVKGIETELNDVISHLVSHVRSDQFMESSFYRMAKAHGVPCIAKPLENLDKVEKKPWVYTSGGSMSTLVSAYFKLEEKPAEVSRWVEDANELLAFFIDSVKQLPPSETKLLETKNICSLLMHSPTHAFLMKPEFDRFKEACSNDVYTYTWIKQKLIEPAERMLLNIHLEEEMMRAVLDEVYHTIPLDFRPRFNQLFQRLPYRLSPKDFRNYVVNTIHSDRGMKSYHGSVLATEEIDRVLFSMIPFIDQEKIFDVAIQVLPQALEGITYDPTLLSSVIQSTTSRIRRVRYISASRLMDILKVICAIIIGKTRVPFDLHERIIENLRSNSLLLPKPLIFADSNWVRDYFAFVLSPSTNQLEFWSVDFYGISGRPIEHWKMWINGSRKDLKWGVFNHPHEYLG